MNSTEHIEFRRAWYEFLHGEPPAVELTTTYPSLWLYNRHIMKTTKLCLSNAPFPQRKHPSIQQCTKTTNCAYYRYPFQPKWVYATKPLEIGSVCDISPSADSGEVKKIIRGGWTMSTSTLSSDEHQPQTPWNHTFFDESACQNSTSSTTINFITKRISPWHHSTIKLY